MNSAQKYIYFKKEPLRFRNDSFSPKFYYQIIVLHMLCINANLHLLNRMPDHGLPLLRCHLSRI